MLSYLIYFTALFVFAMLSIHSLIDNARGTACLDLSITIYEIRFTIYNSQSTRPVDPPDSPHSASSDLPHLSVLVS